MYKVSSTNNFLFAQKVGDNIFFLRMKLVPIISYLRTKLVPIIFYLCMKRCVTNHGFTIVPIVVLHGIGIREHICDQT